MAKIIILVGLPGCGKSTLANDIANNYGYIVHSSDKIREEFGDVNDQSNNNDVFTLLHNRIKSDLRAGKNVIYDATNLNRRRRMNFLNHELHGICCTKTCILVATPWEICLARNFARDRQVPENVMCEMYKKFQMPCKQEGFDKVHVFYQKYEWRSYFGDVMTYIDSLRNFTQDNSHHALTLGDHMNKAGLYALHLNGRIYNNVILATFTHDIGKPDTKSFIDKDGNISTEARYFSHHNVGAYKSLFFRYPEYGNNQDIALLIELHMRPLMEWKQSKKAKEKDRKIFGDDVISEVELLHCADVYAH